MGNHKLTYNHKQSQNDAISMLNYSLQKLWISSYAVHLPSTKQPFARSQLGPMPTPRGMAEEGSLPLQAEGSTKPTPEPTPPFFCSEEHSPRQAPDENKP